MIAERYCDFEHIGKADKAVSAPHPHKWLMRMSLVPWQLAM